MQVVLHPRYAPSGNLRVWLGIRPLTQPPSLRWTLDGQAVVPQPIRAIQSARPADLLVGSPPRVFTGVYEFPNVPGSHGARIGVTATDSSGASAANEIRAKMLPPRLPEGTDEWFNILLVSCYHYSTSPKDVLAGVMFDIAKTAPPSLSLLLGDQVYLDLPTIKNFPRDRRALANRFETDYARNWFDVGGYREVLAATPSVAIADDHEYWNNFPHPSPIIQNSWDIAGRTEWKISARALYEAFQVPWPTNPGSEVVIDVPPVSIFIADSRTDRLEVPLLAFAPAVLERLGSWIDRLNSNDETGIFVTGQSVFDAKAGRISGAVGDRTLPNYDDFSVVIEHLSRAKSPIICITGDVHWGRVLQVRDSWRENRVCVYEIITSPTSLVETVGSDQWNDFKGLIGRAIGRPNPWPRHSPANPYGAWPGKEAGRFQSTTLHEQTGDQVAVLSLRRFGDGVQARVGYFGLHRNTQLRTVTWSQPFDLSAGMSDEF